MPQRGDTRPNTLADDIDQLLIAGTSVAEVVEKSPALASARGGKPHTPVQVRRHMKYRTDRGWQQLSLSGGEVQLVPPPWHRHAKS